MQRTNDTETTALYCRTNGRRLAPHEADAPNAGSALAVLSMADGTPVPLCGDTIIGRSPEDDLRVKNGKAVPLTLKSADKSVSRSHVFLRVTRWEVEAIDLGSTNGTALAHDGDEWVPLVPGLGTYLEDGQLIKLGETVMRIHRLAR